MKVSCFIEAARVVPREKTKPRGSSILAELNMGKKNYNTFAVKT